MNVLKVLSHWHVSWGPNPSVIVPAAPHSIGLVSYSLDSIEPQSAFAFLLRHHKRCDRKQNVCQYIVLLLCYYAQQNTENTAEYVLRQTLLRRHLIASYSFAAHIALILHDYIVRSLSLSKVNHHNCHPLHVLLNFERHLLKCMHTLLYFLNKCGCEFELLSHSRESRPSSIATKLRCPTGPLRVGPTEPTTYKWFKPCSDCQTKSDFGAYRLESDHI